MMRINASLVLTISKRDNDENWTELIYCIPADNDDGTCPGLFRTLCWI